MRFDGFKTSRETFDLAIKIHPFLTRCNGVFQTNIMERHICAECGKTFSLKRNLIVHEKAHHGVLPFSCCGKMFPSRRQLQRHR